MSHMQAKIEKKRKFYLTAELKKLGCKISTNAKIDNWTFSTDSYDIDLSACKKGIYIIEAINGNILSAQKISKW